MELDTFLAHVFGDVPAGEVIGIVQRGKETRGWMLQAYKKNRTKLRADAASYYCISTLKRPEGNEPLQRFMQNMARCYVIVLDDIGTKIATDKFDGKPLPHYVMETSPGNHQYGLKFAGTLEEAQVLIEAMIDAGYSDPGARDVHRLVRLPGSQNFKYEPPFTARVVEENWDQPAWTFAELVEEFGLKPREPGALRNTKRTWNGDTGGDVILKWLAETGMVLSEPNSEGWVFIECPWADEHTDGRRDAKYQVGNGATGSWHCFHAACQSRTQKDFTLYCKANGAPDFEEEAAKQVADVGAKLAKIPKGVFAAPGPIPPPPEGATAGDILTGLVLKYSKDLKKEQLPSLEVTAKGGVKDVQKPVAENVQYLIEQCGFGVLRNQLTGEVELAHPDPAFDALKMPEERAMLTRELLISLGQRLGMPLRTTLSELLGALAGNNGYNPLLDWVLSKPWDGVDRLRPLLDAFETPMPEWRDIVVMRWCVQCIVAWTNWMRETPISISQVLVLVGPQGCGKSSIYGSLLPAPWRLLEQSAHLGHASSKDDERRLTTGVGITELAEIESLLSRVEAGQLKSFISRPVDRIRLPYDRHVTTRARGTAFGGSVNDMQFLNDPTGARRFWPLEVTRCNFRHGIDMQQFWAQMAVLYDKGTSWTLLPEEVAMHAKIVEEHRVVSNAEGRLEELHARMAHVPRNEWTFATPSIICRYYGLDNNYSNARTAGSYLRKVFGQRMSNNGRKGWYVPIKQTEFMAGYSPYIPPEVKK
jgi:hypothetical protein